MGLLEIHENDIIALSDPMDLNNDGISGRVSWIYDESLFRVGRQKLLLNKVPQLFFMIWASSKCDPFGDCTINQTKCINGMEMIDYEVPNNFRFRYVLC